MVPAEGEMITCVAGHAFSIVRHEHALVGLAENEEIGIQSAKRRRTPLPDPQDVNACVESFDLHDKVERQVLIEQKPHPQSAPYPLSEGAL